MNFRDSMVVVKIVEVLKALEVCARFKKTDSEWVRGLIAELEDLILEDEDENA